MPPRNVRSCDGILDPSLPATSRIVASKSPAAPRLRDETKIRSHNTWLTRGYREQLTMWVRVIFSAVLLLLPTSVFAQTEKRIALLIGNRTYDASVGGLKNPHNDIAVVGEALAKQGFKVLPLIRDARRSVILGGVRELVRHLNTAGAGAIGFFYYSGHGA